MINEPDNDWPQMEHMDDLRRNKKEFSDWDMTLHTHIGYFREKNEMREIHWPQ